MQKKSISKRSYYLLNTLFHSLCLAGLLWQVTKVSIDFFHYEVMKDINIIMPEEVMNKDKVFFMCVWFNIFDMDQYERILATKNFDQLYNESEAFEDCRRGNYTPSPSTVVKRIFSAKERIATFSNVTIFLEFYSRRSLNSSKFFFGNLSCFQVNNGDFWMKKSDIKYFYIHLSGKPLPYLYAERLFYVSNLTSLQRIDFNYYSYSITGMEEPYQDKCFNYKTTKQAAIAECIHHMFPGDTFYTDYDLIDENNPVYQNQTYKFVSYTDGKICENRYIQSHCNETIYFNQIDMRRNEDAAVYNETEIDIFAPEGDISPSFIMKSKARINLIDFITYVMGALGSWIGFSFLLINPVPILFKIKNNSISDFEETPCGSNQDEISNRNKLGSDRMKSRIRSIEYKLHTTDQRQGETWQKMSAQGQTISAIQQQISIHGQKLDQILREITALKTSK